MTSFKRIFLAIAISMMAFGLGGCATSGQFNGLSSDPLRMMIVIRADGEPLTVDQKLKVLEVAVPVAEDVRKQFSSPLEAGVAAGVGNLVATQASGLTFVTDGIASLGGLNAAVGVIGGFASYSFAMVAAVAEATNLSIEYRVANKTPGYEILEPVRVLNAYVRSNNSIESFGGKPIRR